MESKKNGCLGPLILFVTIGLINVLIYGSLLVGAVLLIKWLWQ